MKKEKEIEGQTLIRGEFHDRLEYGITKEDWRKDKIIES